MNRCWLLTANCIVKCIPAFRCPQPSGVQNPLAFHYPSWLIETPAFQSWMMMIPQNEAVQSCIQSQMLGNQTLFISCHHYPPASPYVAQQGLVFTALSTCTIGTWSVRPFACFLMSLNSSSSSPHPVRQRDHSIIYGDVPNNTATKRLFDIDFIYKKLFLWRICKEQIVLSHQWKLNSCSGTNEENA